MSCAKIFDWTENRYHDHSIMALQSMLVIFAHEICGLNDRPSYELRLMNHDMMLTILCTLHIVHWTVQIRDSTNSSFQFDYHRSHWFLLYNIVSIFIQLAGFLLAQLWLLRTYWNYKSTVRIRNLNFIAIICILAGIASLCQC